MTPSAFLGRLKTGLLMMCSFHPGASQANDKLISWQMPDFPPVLIKQGPHQGTGYADVFLSYFISKTPEFQHKIEASSMSRVFGLMKQGQQVCEPSLLKTPERETYVDFSDPVEFTLPHHIVVRADRVGRLSAYQNKAGEIDLRRLLSDTSLVTVRQEKRGYPTIVQQAFDAAAKQKNLLLTSDDDQGPFRQIANGWIDYFIAYPDEVHWFGRQLGLAQSFAYFPIAGLPEYVYGHVGCTKSAWGKQVVQRVNQIVAKAGKRPPWIDAAVRHFDPLAAQRYEAAYARHSPFRQQEK